MKKRQSYHHKDLKNELIENGIELVNMEGTNSFSLRKVAAACGVSHSAPYSHFQTKEELLNAMQNHVANEFANMLKDTIAARGDSPDILEHLGRAYVVFFMENPHYFSFLHSQSNTPIDLSLHKDISENYAPFEIFKELIMSLMIKTDYPKEKYKDTIIALWALIHGITSLATINNVHYDEDWKNKITDLLRVFNCPLFEDNRMTN
jgi:AcrR family transcriptional regulator